MIVVPGMSRSQCCGSSDAAVSANGSAGAPAAIAV
jgi:hypothetical protein